MQYVQTKTCFFSIQTFNSDALTLSDAKKETAENLKKLLSHHIISMGEITPNHLCTSQIVGSSFVSGLHKNLELER